MKQGLIVILALAVIVGGWMFLRNGEETQINTDNTQMDTDTTTEATDLPDGIYEVDTEASVLGWQAERIVGNSHMGTVDIQGGQAVVAEGSLAEGAFTVDMQSITESNNNSTVVTHLKSEDFFAVEMYPTNRFVVKNIGKVDSPSDEASYVVTGDLTIRDITQEISFPAIITQVDGALTVSSKFEIDRTRWDINFDSGSIFQQLGDKAIRDEVKFDLNLVLRLNEE